MVPISRLLSCTFSSKDPQRIQRQETYKPKALLLSQFMSDSKYANSKG